MENSDLSDAHNKMRYRFGRHEHKPPVEKFLEARHPFFVQYINYFYIFLLEIAVNCSPGYLTLKLGSLSFFSLKKKTEVNRRMGEKYFALCKTVELCIQRTCSDVIARSAFSDPTPLGPLE